MDWTMVPVASATPVSEPSRGTIFSVRGAEERLMTDDPGGRTKTSAPMPLARRALASNVP